MSEPTNKQLSRRDALKLLGAAAGASVLANLPSKWSTPQSVAGVLPAHAQSSCTRIFSATFEKAQESSPEVKLYVKPTWESVPGTIAGPGPFAPTAGYEVSWECESGCLEIEFWGIWSFKFPDGTTDKSPYDDPRPWVGINLGTGQYKLLWVPDTLEQDVGCDFVGVG